MKLSKKVVNTVCVSFVLMTLLLTSDSNIENNSNLSSIENIDEKVNTVIKSEEDKNEQEEVIEEDNEEQEIISEGEKEDNNLEENIYSENQVDDNEVDIRESVIYLRNDITKVSGITTEELENVLLTYKGASTMAHLSNAFVDAEKEYGVNAFAMAGIVALESGFATSRRAVEDNNLTGYEVYSDDSEGRLFKSQYESIMHTARHLSKNYLTEGAMYYNGISVDAVQKKYCPDIKNNWHNKVDKLASGFFSVYNELY